MTNLFREKFLSNTTKICEFLLLPIDIPEFLTDRKKELLELFQGKLQ